MDVNIVGESRSDGIGDSVNECPICFEVIKNNELYILDCCKQSLHNNCYINCIAISGICPMCRAAHLTNIRVQNPLLENVHSIQLLQNTQAVQNIQNSSHLPSQYTIAKVLGALSGFIIVGILVISVESS